MLGDAGISNVEIKFANIRKTIGGEGEHLGPTDTEVRKRGDQTGLETLVVHAVNYGC